MSTLTETLRLVISGDSKGAQRALSDLENKAMGSEKTLSGSMKKWNTAANWAAGGFVALGVVIGKSVKDYADFAITVAKVNAMTDLGAEATSKFVGQLQFFHADTSKAGMVVKTLEKSIYGLETGSKASVTAFKALGLTWDDLKNLKPEDQLALIRDRLSEVKDTATRTTVASTLLGRGAKDMSLWYTASSAAIAKVNANLKANGQILSEGQLRAAEQAAVAWQSFSGAMKGVEYTIAQSVLPTLTKFLQVVTWLVQRVRPLAPLIVPLTIALGTFVGVVKTAVFFQRTWGQLLELLPRKLLKSKLAEEGATLAVEANTEALVGNDIAGAGAAGGMGKLAGASGGLKGALLSLGGTGGVIALIVAGIAADIYLLGKAWDAYQSANAAENQLRTQTQDTVTTAAAAQDKINAWKAAHPGQALPADYQALQNDVSSAATQIGHDKLQTGIWGYLTGQGLSKFATGGTVRARSGGTLVLAGEAGEDEDFVPKSKRRAYARAVLGDGTQPTVLVTGNTFVGTSKDAERHITEIVNRRLGRRSSALTRGMAVHA